MCGGISETKVDFMAHATSVEAPLGVRIWKSWKREEIEAYKVLTASSSAPLYFAPYEIDGRLYIDGGIISNSPNVMSVVEGIKRDVPLDEIKMINFSINTLFGYRKKKDLIGLLNVANAVPGLAVWGTEHIEAYQAEKLIGADNFCSVCPTVDLEIDTKDFDKMQKIADQLWDERKDDICGLV